MADSKDQILLDFPESFETERLLIRAPLWGDGVSMNEAIRESIDELRPWMAFAQVIPTLEESEKVTREGRLEFLKGISYICVFLEGIRRVLSAALACII